MLDVPDEMDDCHGLSSLLSPQWLKKSPKRLQSLQNVREVLPKTVFISSLSPEKQLLTRCSTDCQETPENEPSNDELGVSVTSDPEKSDSDDDDDGNQQEIPMDNWEEFEEDATYQKKRVDPEMRKWILTKDCRRIISDEYFNNPPQRQGTHSLLSRKQTNLRHI